MWFLISILLAYFLPAGLKWLAIPFTLLAFVFFRRDSARKAGEAVGRAKAKIPNSQKSDPPLIRNDSALSSDFNKLDLKPGASFDDVKHAYRELAKVWHPDRFGNDEKLKDRANTKLGEINAAYERLKNHFGK